jgi:hypothetical protein
MPTNITTHSNPTKAIANVLVALVLFIPCVLLLLLLLIWKLLQVANKNNEKVGESIRDVAKGNRVVAGLSALWAWIVAPTGLAAVGVKLGIVSPPLIVVIAPVLLAISGATLTMSAAVDLYSKLKS